jgi:putative ABC transport system substrate-binding protein
MKRRMLIALIGGLAIAWPFAAHAQKPKQSLKRVGMLVASFPCPLQPDNFFVRRLGELGWVEGQTMIFDCLSAVGRLDQLPILARELASRRPDVLMAAPWTFVSVLKQETTTIPIVMLSGFEPVRLGLIANFAHPNGNVTGVAWFWSGLKQMELLKEVVPNLRRVAYVSGVVGSDYASQEANKIVEEYLQIAASHGFTWRLFRVAGANDYDELFAQLAAEHFDAVIVSSHPLNTQNQTRIEQLTLRYRIPAASEMADWAKSGFLLSYGQDVSWSYARAMDYVDKILRGAKPSDLPVEQATKLRLTINLKTAKALGLTVPPTLLARADEVIE